MTRNVTILAIALCAGLLGFATAAQVYAGDLAAAQQNYMTFCVKCHGSTGRGDGPAAATLKKSPRDFTNCVDMKVISDDTLFRVIHDGGGRQGLSPDMPAWNQGFEDGEIRDLVEYVRTFCKQ